MLGGDREGFLERLRATGARGGLLRDRLGSWVHARKAGPPGSPPEPLVEARADMKDMIASILRMLDEGAPEQKVAAALVLAWIRPNEARVVQTLGHLAREGEGYLKPYVIQALGAIGTNAALAALIPLLRVEGPLRERVSQVLAKVGTKAEAVLGKEYEQADDKTKEIILQILAKSRGPEAMRRILAVLKDPEQQNFAGFAVDILCTEIENLGEGEEAEEQKAKLRKVLVQSLKRLPKSAAKEYPLHLLTLLGKVPDASLRNLFFQYAGKSKPPEIRRVALLGLAGMALTQSQQNTLVSFLESEDFHNVAGPALEALGDFTPSGSSMANALAKLLKSPRVEVRLFAMRSLGHFQTATTAKLLLPYLKSSDPNVRRTVSEALGRNKEARQGLLKMLFAARDLEEAGRPRPALEALAPHLTQPQLKKLVQRYMDLMKASDPVREIYHSILVKADPDLVGPMLIHEAKKLKNARRHAEAVMILSSLTGDRHTLADEVRYELAVNQMLGREHAPSPLEGDPVIGHFASLIASGFPLLQRIKRERLLTDEHRLYVGLKFLDRIQEDKKFGYQLLEYLIQKNPESKEAVQALQKLKIEGLA